MAIMACSSAFAEDEPVVQLRSEPIVIDPQYEISSNYGQAFFAPTGTNFAPTGTNIANPSVVTFNASPTRFTGTAAVFADVTTFNTDPTTYNLLAISGGNLNIIQRTPVIRSE